MLERIDSGLSRFDRPKPMIAGGGIVATRFFLSDPY
jgi:hypothetical protein